jgi:hypothetical protein
VAASVYSIMACCCKYGNERQGCVKGVKYLNSPAARSFLRRKMLNGD